MYLNLAQTPALDVQTQSAGKAPPNTAATPNYVTNSDLEALERRFQVMVSEATASFSSQLHGLTPPPAWEPAQTVTTSTRTGIPRHSTVAGVTGAREKRNPATRRIRQRERSSPVTRDLASEELTSPNQHGTSKLPKPRLHLNVQMFRKHPIFKFFVTAPIDSENNPHKWRCRVCQVELSLKTKGALENLSHYRTEAHPIREHRIRMETPGLPLFGKNEQELFGLALDEAREKAESEFPIAPTLGECYLLPGQRELPADIGTLDPSAVICSQIRVLFIGLQHGCSLESLSSLWSNLGLEARSPVRIPQFDWSQERVFVGLIFAII